MKLDPRSTSSSRRQFLATTAGAGIAMSVALAGGSALYAGASISERSHSNLKTSLNAFSFLELLNLNAKDPKQGVDLFGVCDFCSKIGFSGVDLTGYFFPGYPAIPDDDYIFRLKRHAFKLGLGISGTGVRNDFTSASPAVREEGVGRIKAWIEVAAKLGAPTIRAFADSQPPHGNWQAAADGASREKVEAWLADALRECAQHGKKFGVLVAVQNHGDFISTGAEHLSLIKRVDHKWCAPLVDTGKYLTDDPYADIALVAPYAVNWQIKETTRSTLESPRIDLKRLLSVIRSSGYQGYLPIETLRMGRSDYDSFVAIEQMHSALQAALSDGII